MLIVEKTSSPLPLSGAVVDDLKRKGQSIGAYDLLIAAHALAEGLTLLTNNTKEFNRVAGLTLENWAQ